MELPLEQAVQSRHEPKRVEQESSSWKWLGEMSQATIDGVKAVAAPGFSASTSLFGAATRACYWLAQESWQTIFGSSIAVGESDAAKNLSEDWEKLRKSAPSLDKLGHRLGEITSQLEGMPEDSPAALELLKQRDEIATELTHRLKATSATLKKTDLDYAKVLKSEIASSQAAGLSTDEIEKKSALIKKGDELEHEKLQARETLKQLSRLNSEGHIKTHECIDISQKGSDELAHERGFKSSSEVNDEYKKLHEATLRGHCCIGEKITQAERLLDSGNVEESHACILSLHDDMGSQTTELQNKFKAMTEVRNAFLLHSGISVEEIAKLAQSDRQFYSEIRNFAHNFSIALLVANESYHQIYSVQEELCRESQQYMRMTSSAYTGGAGSSILTLGLFEGPYALTALSFLAEHVRLEKLAEKFAFLAPPATQEEREEYRRIS